MDIICFANDWDGDPLSKKHIMRGLAARGARVLWVNSLGNRAPRAADRRDHARAARKLARFAGSALRGPRPVEKGIWVIDPISVPAFGSPLAERANRALIGAHVRAAADRLGFHRPIHYSFLPASAWVAGHLGESALVYHAADEYAAFAGAHRAALLRLEDTLLERADLYIACSAPLMRKASRCRSALLVRHGVEHGHFARALDPATPVPAALAAQPRPVVGFMGLIAEWIDLRLLGQLADALPGGTLVLVGDVRGAHPAALAPLRARKNIRFVGRRPYAELPGWCRGFDVGILPFVVDELTEHANPLKLREYLAAGLPVVTSDLPEARTLAEGAAAGALDVTRSSLEFVSAVVQRAQASDAGPRRERSAMVAHEGWETKVAELYQALAALQRGEKEFHDGRAP